MTESADSPSPSPVSQLEAVETQLAQLQNKVQDLRELDRIQQLPPAQLAELEEQLVELDQRLQTYIGEEVIGVPTLFWQVVRFVGLGMVLGFALGKAWGG